VADLAIAAGIGIGNCFEGNTAVVLEPAGLAASCRTHGDASEAVADALALPPPEMLGGLPSAPPFGSMPAPGEQQTLPTASSGDPVRLAIPALILALGVLGLLIVFRRRRRVTVSPSRG
jgi:hypothetical protein